MDGKSGLIGYSWDMVACSSVIVNGRANATDDSLHRDASERSREYVAKKYQERQE